MQRTDGAAAPPAAGMPPVATMNAPGHPAAARPQMPMPMPPSVAAALGLPPSQVPMPRSVAAAIVAARPPVPANMRRSLGYAAVDAHLVAFAERAQLRLQNPRKFDADVEDWQRSAARGGAVLQRVAEAALAQLRGLDAFHDASSAVCDVFYYPKSEQSPCPAHEDPGLVTVIADDAPGLEVRDADGAWRSVVLAEDEVAILGNSGLAKIAGHPACTHRVVPCAERVSITVELRLNEAGVRAAAAAERARLLGDAGAGSPPRWLRETDRRAGCAVM